MWPYQGAVPNTYSVVSTECRPCDSLLYALDDTLHAHMQVLIYYRIANGAELTK